MDDRILNKIKKCLALSQSSEPAEAAAALRQAQKLMEVHGVSQADLGLSEIGEAEVKSKASVSRVKDWELRLINLVAKAFGCKLLWLKSNSYSADVYGRYTLVGLKGQVELAQYTCEVLQRKLVAARAKFVNHLPNYLGRKAKTMEADGFCHGWTQAISRTVHEFTLNEEQAKLLETYVDERSTGKAGVQSREVGSYGLEAGRAAGANESLHRPVNGRQQAYLTYD